jgi:hypothetical protein
MYIISKKIEKQNKMKRSFDSCQIKTGMLDPGEQK